MQTDRDFRAELDALDETPTVSIDTEPAQPLTQTGRDLVDSGVLDRMGVKRQIEEEEARETARRGSNPLWQEAEKFMSTGPLGYLVGKTLGRGEGGEGTLGTIGLNSDDDKLKWIADEKVSADRSLAFWGSIKKTYGDSIKRGIAPVLDYSPQGLIARAALNKAGVLGDDDTLGDQFGGWLDRKTQEGIALAKRRRMLAEEMEAGTRAAPKFGALRSSFDDIQRGMSRVIAGGIKGVAYGIESGDLIKINPLVDGFLVDTLKRAGYISGNPSEAQKRNIYRFGAWIENEAQKNFPEDEARANEFRKALSEGVGSMIAFMGTGYAAMALGKGAGVATIVSGMTGGLSQAGSMTDDALKKYLKDAETEGRKLTPEEERKATQVWLMGLGIGATEAVPLANFFAGHSGRFVRGVLLQATEEGGQEWVQAVLENVVAQRYYDPERKWDDNAWEGFAIGGILGSSMQASQAAIDRRRGKKPEEPPKVAPPAKAEERAPDLPPMTLPDVAPSLDGTDGGPAPKPKTRRASDPGLDKYRQTFEAVVPSQPNTDDVQTRRVLGKGLEEIVAETEPNDAVSRIAGVVSKGLEQGKIPTMAEVMEVLPKDERGDPDMGRLVDELDKLGVRAWNSLNDDQRRQVYEALAPVVEEVAPVVDRVVEAVAGQAAQQASAPSAAEPRRVGTSALEAWRDQAEADAARSRRKPAPGIQSDSAVWRISDALRRSHGDNAPAAMDALRASLIAEGVKAEKIPANAGTLEEWVGSLIKGVNERAALRLASVAPAPSSEVTDSLRQSFNSVLNSKAKRSEWQKAIGATKAQLDALVNEALADGRLKKTKAGGIARTGKKVEVKAAAGPTRAQIREQIDRLDKRIENARASLSIGRPTQEDIDRTDALVRDLEAQKAALRTGQPSGQAQPQTRVEPTLSPGQGTGQTRTIDRATERRLDAVKSDVARGYAQQLIDAGTDATKFSAIVSKLSRDKKAPVAVVHEVATVLTGEKGKTRQDSLNRLAAAKPSVAAEPAPAPAEVAPPPAPAPAQPTAQEAIEAFLEKKVRIEDAGEKIGGARKDTWASRGLNLEDLVTMSNGEQAKYVTKDGVWPKPDYAAMVADGMPAEVAALVKLIRDGLAAKPKVDTPDGRRAYVTMMGHVRSEFEKVRSVEDISKARDRIVYELVGWPRGTFERGNKDQSAVLFSVFKGRREALRPDGQMQRKARQMVADGFPGDVEPWTRRFSVRRWPRPDRPENYMVLNKQGRMQSEHPTEDEAKAAAKALYEAETAKASDEPALPERPHLDSVVRTGKDIRGGRDVDGNDFLKDFGFRGIEFGNWVASDERQKVVNLAYDALHDMANVLGIPPRAVSLNGSLGLAFGARGSGKFLAHYEPAKLVINMTKLRGAGSLAHEWAHALDHYFGELNRQDAYQGQARGASGWYDRAKSYSGQPITRFDRTRGKFEEMRLANIRPEMSAAFDGVMDALFNRDRTQADVVRDRELALERAQGNVKITEQRLATFEASDAKAQERNAQYGKSLRDYLVGAKERVALLEKALKEARSPGFKPSGKVESSFYTEAKKLSGKQGEKGYWARPTEMFARSLESYVFDKIAKSGVQSDYLVQGVEADRYADPKYKGNPYPAGAERDAINAAYDRLFETMEPKQTQAVADFARSVSDLKAKLGVTTRPLSTDESKPIALYALGAGAGTALVKLSDQIRAMTKGSRVQVVAETAAAFVSEVNSIVDVVGQQTAIDPDELSVTDVTTLAAALFDLKQIIDQKVQAGYALAEDVQVVRDLLSDRMDELSSRFDEIAMDAETIRDDLNGKWDEIQDRIDEIDEETGRDTSVEDETDTEIAMPSEQVGAYATPAEYDAIGNKTDVFLAEEAHGGPLIKSLQQRAEALAEIDISELSRDELIAAQSRISQTIGTSVHLMDWMKLLTTKASEASTEVFDVVNEIGDGQVTPAVDLLESAQGDIDDRLEAALDAKEIAEGEIVEIDGVQYGPTLVRDRIASWEGWLRHSGRETLATVTPEHAARRMPDIERVEGDLARFKEALAVYEGAVPKKALYALTTPQRAITEDRARKAVRAALKLGKAVRLNTDTVEAMRDATTRMPAVAPAGTVTGFLFEVRPLKKGNIRAYFETNDGSLVHFDGSPDDFIGSRAFFVKARGGPSIFHVRFATPGQDGIASLASERWHESIHALRAAEALAGPTWDLLLSHANSLRILEMTWRSYLQAVGDPAAENANPNATIMELYYKAYSGRMDQAQLQEALDQESVAIMTELLVMGVDLPLPDNVRSVLRDIETGEIQKQGGMAELEDGLALAALGDGAVSGADKVANVDAIISRIESMPKEQRRPLSDKFDVIINRSVGRANYELVPKGKPLWKRDGTPNSVGTFQVKPSSRDVTGVEVTNAKLREEYQRQGIGTKIYDMIEADFADLGGLSPSTVLSPIAQAFWRKRTDHFSPESQDRKTLARHFGATRIEDIGPDDPHPGRVLAFHGTGQPIEGDRLDMRGQSRSFGVHFGTSDQASTAARKGMQATRDGANLMPAVLDLSNVVTLPRDQMEWYVGDLISEIKAAQPELADALAPVEKDYARRLENGTHDLPTIRQLQDALTSAGVDGLRYRNEGEGPGWSYIVWEPGKVISATSGNMLFALGSGISDTQIDADTGQSMRRDLDSLGFYSKALEAARGLKQEKGTPEQMLAQLKKAGVKDAEIQATGLDRLFKDGSTTALESDAITLPPVSVTEQPDGRTLIEALSPAGRVRGYLDAQTRTIQDPSSGVNEDQRGKGVGVALYSAFANKAAELGYTIRSANPVTVEAARVYEALKRRGYNVVRHPNARNVDGVVVVDGSTPGNDSPFTIYPQQQGDRTASPTRHDDLFNFVENSGFVIAEQNGASISYAGRPNEVYVHSLEVKPRDRRQGRARALMQKFVEHADAEGKSIRMHVGDLRKAIGNDNLVEFYRSLGFQTEGERDGNGFVYMVRLPQQQGDRTASPTRRARLNQITRSEIISHLEKNRVGLREVVGQKWQIPNRIGDKAAYIEKMEAAGIPDVKWQNHSLDPSNPTYRETVIHLPDATPNEVAARIRRMYDEAERLNLAGRRDEADRLYAQATALDESTPAPFTSGHFSEPNIIGHMMTSMVKHEGKPAYLIDQIQSDWGQNLRDGGVRDEAKIAELKAKSDAADAAFLKAEKEARELVKKLEGGGIFSRRPSTDEIAKLQDAASAAGAEARRLRAEYVTANTAAPGHPLVNTTDQWTTTTLRRAIRQAVEAGADYIAIPTGDTVLSYNPGDTAGMRGFYGYHPRVQTNEPALEGIVPKNLRKLLSSIDKSSPAPARIDQLETPSGMKGEGFTLFPLTERVKDSVLEYGQPMFALGGGIPSSNLDMSKEARMARAEAMGFDTSRTLYRGTRTLDNDPTWLTPYPQWAANFSGDNGAIAAYWIRPSNYLVVKEQGGLVKWFDDNLGFEQWMEKGKGRNWTIDLARSLGKDGVIWENTWHDGPQVYVVNKSSIRSVNAAFDPAEDGSPILLAALGGGIPPVDPRDSEDAPSLNKVIQSLKDTLGIVPTQTLLGVTIKAGDTEIRLNPRGNVRGQTQMATGAIGVRKSRAIDVISHEAAHYLETTLGAEIMDLQTIHAAELALVNPAATPSEQWAEWFADYMLDPVGASVRAPLLHSAVEDILEANGMLEGIHETQDLYQQWLERATPEELASDVVSIHAGNSFADLRADRPLGETIPGRMATAYTNTIDDLNPLSKIVRKLLAVADRNGVVDEEGRPISLKVADNPYKIARMFRGSYATGYSWLTKGIANRGETSIAFAPLSKALETLFGSNNSRNWDPAMYQAAGQYLISRRAIAEYDRLEQKQARLEEIDGLMEQGAEAWRQVSLQAQDAATVLERRETALVRQTALMRDRRNALKSAEATVARLQERIQDKKDDVTAAQMARDANLTDRRRRDLAIIERDSQRQLRQVEGLIEEYEQLSTDVAMLEAEIDQLRQRNETAREQLAGIDEAMAGLRRERQATEKRGASRAPTRESKEWHQEFIAKTEADPKYARIKDFAALVAEFGHGMLTLRHQAGLISDELFEELSKRKDWFVPFQRDMSDASPENTFFRGAGVEKWSPFKKFDGSDRAIINPLETMASDAYSLAQQIAFNDATNALAKLAERAGEGGASIVQVLTREESAEANAATFDRIKNIAMSMGIDEADALRIVSEMEQNFAGSELSLIWSPATKGPVNLPTVPLYRDGERIMVRFTDPEFGIEAFNAMSGMGKETAGIISEILGYPSRLLQQGVTTHPTFIPRNVFRDIFDAWIKTGAMPIVTQARGVKAMRDQDFMRRYMEAGGITGGRNLAALTGKEKQLDVLDLADKRVSKGNIGLGLVAGGLLGATVAGPLGILPAAAFGAYVFNRVGALETVESAETMTRLGVAAHAYKRALAHNPSLSPSEAMLEAAFVARDVFDWNRRGSKMIGIVRTITFLNAQIQGMDSAARRLGGENDRGMVLAKHMNMVWRRENGGNLSADEERALGDAYKTFGRMALYTGLLISLYALATSGGDDDDTDKAYQDIRDKTKITHSWLPAVFGTDVRLPKAFEWAMPANAIEAIADGIRGRNPHVWDRIVDSVYEIAVPPTVPQGLNLIMGLAANVQIDQMAPWVKRLLGREAEPNNPRQIVGDSLRRLDPEAQFDAWSSQLSIDVAKAMSAAGVPRDMIPSPKKIDFILRTGGYWGQDVQKGYQVLKEAFGGRQREAARISDLPVVAGFTGVAARQSRSRDELFRLVSQQGGVFTTAAQTFKNLIDDQGTSADAERFISRLEPDERTYALLQYYGSPGEKKTHPLDRLKAVDGVANKIRQDIILDRLAPIEKKDGKKVRNFEKKIALNSRQQTQVHEILERLMQAEAWNTMTFLERPAWKGRTEIKVQPILDELYAANAQVHEVYVDRLEKAHAKSWEEVTGAWPALRDRILRQGAGAWGR